LRFGRSEEARVMTGGRMHVLVIEDEPETQRIDETLVGWARDASA